MEKYETILLEKYIEHSGVYQLTLNRPKALNSMSTQMALDIIDAIKKLRKKDDIRVLIITATGEKSFCVGADLKERHGMNKKQWQDQHDIFEAVTESIRNFEFPVIAAINGFALGGGLEIALSCDIRIASITAKLGLPESRIGIIPGIGGTQLLPRLIPASLAKEILFRGNHISAEYAKEIGLVNHVYEEGKLIEKTYEISKEIASNAPLSLKMIKKAINNGLQVDLHTGLEIEIQSYYKCADSDDRIEGIKAFNEKRTPNWKGY